MPDSLGPASEFGGKIQKNRVMPPVTPLGAAGHVPTSAERQMLTYTTGGEDSTRDPDDGEAWQGVEGVAAVPVINLFPGA